ncbi:relaxase/mobilization nuclease domain-containing protein [Arenibacter sp. GZD96]|uniref:relaxase/mobilization nuclease domain-containing protein n=1 Tax=Aurantibrevibacter litoralis TaxID=3106030 RepID=UPI002AFFA98C|nr:relaxase/mobilization nuclease domain-containing protein [Arenibacter sp. GZD-96]MEA1786783.1 relaxase/mobilization nuclease domain-containing protein [Arenibacter sp. GZD-96]
MIGKITIGKDFYGVLAYNEKKVDEGVGYVIDSNIEHSTPVNMTQEFNLIRELRPNLGKAVLHVSLNLPHSDFLDDKEFASFGCDYLMKMGFDNNQFIMYRHTDTEHEHIHIIANRVRYSGRITNDSNIKRRSREILNELEKKYGLTQIVGNKNAKKPLTQKEIEKTLRTGNLPIKLVLQDKIGSAISKAKDTREFIGLLEQQHVSPRFNIGETTGRVSGISFRYQDVVYKGSTLGKKISWNTITKHIDYEQTRDRSIVLSANEKERGTHPTGERDHGRSIGPKPRNNGSTEGTENTTEQPKGHLEQIEGNGVTQAAVSETEWNAFKLELLDGNNRKRSKRKKKRRGLGL